MKNIVNNRMCHVLLIFKEMIPSIRLCGHAQMTVLKENGLIEYRATMVSELSREDMIWADVVLIGRLDNPLELDDIKYLSKHKKYLVYIIDDDLLNIPAEFNSAAYYHLSQVKNSIARMMELSDAIMSPSKVLLEKYATNGKRKILIEEPATCNTEFKPHDASMPVRIGFAGSVDRVGDIENVLEEVLCQLKQEYGEHICYTFFGAIPSFATTISAEVIPYTNSYEEYQERLGNAHWDIGLAPLPDTPFHSCKHYNKFIEYAATGITGVFSECGPYLRLKEEIGLGDFCSNSTEAWLEKLRELIDDHTLRENKRKAAWIYAQKHFSVKAIAKKLYEENSCIFQYRAPELNANRFCKNKLLNKFGKTAAEIGWHLRYKTRYCFQRVALLVSAYGWGFPMHIYRKVFPPLLIAMFNRFDQVFPMNSKVRRLIRRIERKDNND